MRPALPLPEGNASEGKWWKGGRGKKKRKGRGKGEKIRKSETEALARPLAGGKSVGRVGGTIPILFGNVQGAGKAGEDGVCPKHGKRFS